jgi:eukaryotic-like serine/threonine-protein kinase
VYSLGAILYELLVGQPPFHAPTAVETMQQVRNDEPLIPKSLLRKLPRDLVLICMTCLRKEPQQRYASAADLANDLQRYLSGNSIQARPPNIFESGLKWTKRHPSATALMASITLATIGMTLLWLRAERSSVAERLERVRAESLVYARNISLADFEFRSSKVEECKKLLSVCPPNQRNWEWRYLDALCDDALWISPRAKLMGIALDMSHDGRFVATGQAEWGIDTHEPISIWDLTTGERVWELPGHPGGTYSVSFSPDGKSLVSSGVLWKKSENQAPGGGVKVWNLEDGTERFDLCNKNAHVVRYSPDGKSILAGLSTGVVVEYASETGNEIVQLKVATQFIADLTFHSNGKLCAACSRDGQVVVWDFTTPKKTVTHVYNLPDPRRITWQPGTNVLIVGCFDGAIKKYEYSESKLELLDTQGHSAVPIIAYSPDGQYLATSVFGERTVIAEVKTGRTTNLLRGHNGHVRALTFDESGQRIATSGNDGSVRVWDLKHHVDYPQQRNITRYQIVTMATHPTKPEIAIVSGENQRRPQPLGEGEVHHVDVFNVTTRGQREIKTRHSNWLTAVAYSPDGATLLTSSLDCSINCIDRNSSEVLRVLQGHSASVVSVAWIDHARAISIDIEGTAKIWQIDSGEVLSSWDTHHSSVVSLLVDSLHHRALVVGRDGTLSFWALPYPNSNSGLTKTELPNEQQVAAQLLQRHDLQLEPSAVALSGDGKYLAVADAAGKVQLWVVSQLLGRNRSTPKHLLNCHADRVTSLAFSPDGTRLLSGSRDESIKLIDVQNGYELIELERSKGINPIVLFTSDGAQVLRAEGGKLWNWAIKPRVDPSSLNAEQARSAATAWHRKQHAIASQSESWFAAQFHSTELHALEPENSEHLKDRATSRTYLLDFAGAEADLLTAINLDPKFELQVALARIQLRLGKQAEYRETCQKLFEHSLHALQRSKNYEMAWVCCLSPDSGIDYKGIHTMLEATRIVNTPIESLPDSFPLLNSALSVFKNGVGNGDPSNKQRVVRPKEFNDSIYALACYRAGKFALAAKHARTATKESTGTQQVDLLTLSMSKARLGQIKEAQAALDTAKAWIGFYDVLNRSGSAENQPKDAATIKRQLNILRTITIEYPILLSEAEKLLAAKRDQ